MTRTHERVRFRLIRCPHCGNLLCWVNPRNPMYCPECGGSYPIPLGECVLFADDDAVLQLHEE